MTYEKTAISLMASITRLVELIDEGNAGNLEYNGHVYLGGFKTGINSFKIRSNSLTGNMLLNTDDALFYINIEGRLVGVTVYMPDTASLDLRVVFCDYLKEFTLNGEKVTDDVHLNVFNGTGGLSNDFLELINGLKYVGGGE